MNQKIIDFALESGLAYRMQDDKYWIDAGYIDTHLEQYTELVRQNYLRELKALKPVAFRKMAHGIWFYIEHKPSPPNDDYEPLYALDGEKV